MNRLSRLKTTDRMFAHELMPRVRHDDGARERYVISLKHELGRELTPGNRTAFERRAAPEFRHRHGHAPATLDDIRSVMARDGLHQMWCALSRVGQELMWDAVAATIAADLPRLEQAARRRRQSNRRLGSLMLNPGVRMPAYVGKIDVHLQPGGYEMDESGDDILAGALYERGGGLYSRGVAIGAHDSKAGALLAFLEDHYAGLNPKRILDLGCSAGGATVSYAEAFPGADVIGIDVGPGMLRYAHARAESMGFAVDFEQMNACETRYPDNHFDLVVSHNLFHEVSAADGRSILRECRRIVRPGGVVAHLDVPARASEMDPFARYMADYQTLYNAEPCWRAYVNMDHRAEMIAAGFAAAAVVTASQPKKDGPGFWWVFAARK